MDFERRYLMCRFLMNITIRCTLLCVSSKYHSLLSLLFIIWYFIAQASRELSKKECGSETISKAKYLNAVKGYKMLLIKGRCNLHDLLRYLCLTGDINWSRTSDTIDNGIKSFLSEQNCALDLLGKISASIARLGNLMANKAKNGDEAAKALLLKDQSMQWMELQSFWRNTFGNFSSTANKLVQFFEARRTWHQRNNITPSWTNSAFLMELKLSIILNKPNPQVVAFDALFPTSITSKKTDESVKKNVKTKDISNKDSFATHNHYRGGYRGRGGGYRGRGDGYRGRYRGRRRYRNRRGGNRYNQHYRRDYFDYNHNNQYDNFDSYSNQNDYHSLRTSGNFGGHQYGVNPQAGQRGRGAYGGQRGRGGRPPMPQADRERNRSRFESKMDQYIKNRDGVLKGKSGMAACKFWLNGTCNREDYLDCKWHHICSRCLQINDHIPSR
eukprot:113666_1